MDFNTIKFEKKKIESWNNTLSSKAYILYPKNILELKKLISIIKKDKKKYLIRTGSCSYDSKSINPDLETIVISLKYFNKITKLDFKNKFIEVEAGALIEKIIKEIKKNHLTLFSVPGGDKISIGGAISANTIGKDSTPGISSFGDALISLEILSNDGKIKKISKNKYNLNKYVGAFGNEGIILKAKLKIKKIKSENVLLKTKILKNINEVRKEFNYKSDYHYIQLDPFFRKKHFAISFKADSVKSNKNYYKSINLKANIFEKEIIRFFGFFINSLTWKIFYKFFFLLNSNLNMILDIHNFHYNSKYKHLVPLVCKKGLLDYEILIKKNFNSEMSKIIDTLKKNKIYPMYIIVKKLYRSKKKFYYSFNDNGYAVAISLNKKKLNYENFEEFKNLLNKNKYQVNLSKTDEKLIKFKKNNNKLFLSLYKKMLLDRYGLSGSRA